MLLSHELLPAVRKVASDKFVVLQQVREMPALIIGHETV